MTRVHVQRWTGAITSPNAEMLLSVGAPSANAAIEAVGDLLVLGSWNEHYGHATFTCATHGLYPAPSSIG